VFPFTLSPGPSTTRNAIALLRHAGFPDPVVADAVQVTEVLEHAGGSLT
jgi:DNA mismatch repair ATPase MutS